MQGEGGRDEVWRGRGGEGSINNGQHDITEIEREVERRRNK